MFAWIRLTRPFNCFFTLLCVFYGALWNNQAWQNTTQVIFAGLAAVAIAAAGYILNDFYDIEIDRINRPKRPLPAGLINPQSAYKFSMWLFSLGTLLALFCGNFLCIVLAAFNTLLLRLYAQKLKQSFLYGNLSVAWAAASTFLFGSLAAGHGFAAGPLFAYAFLFTLCRELIKDAQDTEGDAQQGARTLAVVWGRRAAIMVSALSAVLLITLTFGLYGFDFANNYRLLALLGLVCLPLVISHIVAYAKPKPKVLGVVSTFMKADMLVLLAIMWFVNAV